VAAGDMEHGNILIADVVAAVATAPDAHRAAPAAQHEDGFVQCVAPDRVQVGLPGIDRARLVEHGPDDIGVVFEERGDPEQRAGGAGAKDVEIAVLFPHGEAVPGRAFGQFGEVGGKVAFGETGAKEDAGAGAGAGLETQREVGAGDFVEPMLQLPRGQRGDVTLEAAGAEQFDGLRVLRKPAVDQDVVREVADDFGQSLAVSGQGNGLREPPRRGRAEIPAGVAQIRRVSRGEVRPGGESLRFGKADVGAFDQHGRGDGHDDRGVGRQVSRLVKETQALCAVADKALVAGVVIVAHVPLEILEPIQARIVAVHVIQEVRRGNGYSGPVELAVVDAHAEVVVILVEPARVIAVPRHVHAEPQRLEACASLDFGLEGQNVPDISVEGEW